MQKILAVLALVGVVIVSACVSSGTQNTSATGHAADVIKQTQAQAPEPSNSSQTVTAPAANEQKTPDQIKDAKNLTSKQVEETANETPQAKVVNGAQKLTLLLGDSYSCTSKNYGDLSIWFLDDEWIYTDGYVRVLVNDYSTSDLFRTSWKKAFGDGRIVVELKEAAKNSTIRWKDGQQTRNSNQVTLVVDCNAKPFPEAVKSASVQQGSTGTVKCNDYTISLDSTQIEPLTKPELANIKVEGSGGVEKRAMLNKGALYFLNNSVFVRVKNILVAPPFVDIEYAC